MIVRINDKEYALRYSLRMYYTYEVLTGKIYTPGTLVALSMLFYSAILSNNPEFELDFDHFVDWLDSNPEKLEEFGTWLASELKKKQPVDKKKIAEES